MTDHPSLSPRPAPIPADDLTRQLAVAQPSAPSLPHLGIVGDTYTILLTGEQTAGHYCLIDMYVPPGGGPAPHRHDFEEMFTVLDGEIEVEFRGEQRTARAGETVNIPSNAPHAFKNRSEQPARLLCMCTPAGQDAFFMQLGIALDSRTATPPELTPEQETEFKQKAEALAPTYRTELLRTTTK